LSILTQSPSWFIPLCILAGLAYAGALYFRDRFNRNYGSRLAAVLGVLRFLSVTILAFFVLKPIVRSVERVVEKPVIVIAQDNSESVLINRYAKFYSEEYPQQLKELVNSFGEDFEVRMLRFGESVQDGADSLLFRDRITDMSGLLDEVYTRYSGRNLGAVIIASDGLYNKGKNPVYQSRKLNVPVYTVALGDTTVYRDIRIADVAVNRLAYLGNRFPVNIVVEARKAAALQSVLTVSRGGKTLFSESLTFSGDEDFRTVALSLDAAEVGLQRYTVSLSPVSSEVTELNNRREFFIDVLDGRQQILILSHAPHPDIAAIRDALGTNESYRVTARLAKDFSENPTDFSLAILHQLPSAPGSAALVRQFTDRGIPVLFIWGAQTDFRQFAEIGVGYALDNYRSNLTDAGGQVDESFSLFLLSDQVRDMFRFVPPLSVPFGDIRQGTGTIPFINQQIGRIATAKPLVSFNRMGQTRIGLIAGEGIWRWRLAAFQQYESHDVFNEWMTKTAQYLAAKDDRSLFRVNGAQDFAENSPLVFTAEVYNESYEPVSDRDVRMVIRNENGEEFAFIFSATGARYLLNAGQFPPGNYTYSASVAGAALPKETGEFSVSPLALEPSSTIADHRLLYQLAKNNGGQMVTPEEMSRLPELIRSAGKTASVSYESRQLTDLINYRWILGIILFLLSLEWLLRKRAGTY
jgi:hypothetical protein